MTRLLLGFLVLFSHGFLLAADQPDANLYPAVSKDKTGYINREGIALIPFVYEDGREFSQGLAAVLMDGHWGYINEKAEIVIKPRFQSAGNFSEDRALVQLKGKYGYIDRDGKVVIEPRYDMAGPFSEGYAVVSKDHWWNTSLIDKAGRAALNLDVHPDVFGMNYSGFSEGLVFGFVKDKPLAVYMDKDGKIAISFRKTDKHGAIVQCTPFSEGLAAVRYSRNWGYIDRTGKMVIAPEYVHVTPFRQGFACVSIADKKNGVERWRNFIIDEKGTKIKQIPWTTYGGFSEGLVPFASWDLEKKTHKYGFDKGHREPLYGYIDTRGGIAIEPRFERASPFYKALAQVRIRGKEAYINKQGRPVWVGEARGDEPVTSYSGKSMIDLYEHILQEENWHNANEYIEKMNRKELVEGSLVTLKWLLADPKRTECIDYGRSGVIGMVAVAPFLETYSRSFAKDDKPIDFSPFWSMLFDKSLDIDFRRELARCSGDNDFYVSSWEHIANDTEVLNKLVCDATEDEELRKAASQTCFRLISRLYWILRNETIVADSSTGNEPKKYPDIVAMLAETPCPFSPENKSRWELLVNCTEKTVSGAIMMYEEAKTDKIRKSSYGLMTHSLDHHLLRGKELLKRVEEIKTKEDAKAKSTQGKPK